MVLGILIFSFQIPYVQQKAREAAVSWLGKKIGARVSVGRVSIVYPNFISLEDVFIADAQNDTLLSGGYLGVDFRLGSLLAKGDIVIHEVWLKDIQARLYSDSAGIFNFNHIILAFAPKQSGHKETADSSTSLVFQLETVKMNRVSITYLDEGEGLKGTFIIDQFRARGDQINTDKLEFSMKSLDWNGGNIKVDMWEVPAKPDTLSHEDEGASVLPFFALEKVSISEVDFSYRYPYEGMDMLADIGTFDAEGMVLNLEEQKIGLGSSVIRNSGYTLRLMPTKSNPEVSDTAPSRNWIINAEDMSLINSRFRYDDMGEPFLKKGMDYAHMVFSGINLSGKNLYVSGSDTVSAVITKGALTEKSGLRVKSLRGELLYTAHGLSLKNLLLETPYTRLQKNIEIGYTSPEHVAENPGDLWMQAEFKQAKISHKDLLTVAPLLYEYPMFAGLPNATMEVNGKVKGYLKDLTLDNLTFKGFGNTSIKVNGKITGLPDPDNIGTTLAISQFSTTDKDLLKIIPEGLIPPEIALPERMSLTGTVKGNYAQKLELNIKANTSMGSLSARGFIAQATNPKKASYKWKGDVEGFDIGKLLRRTDIGKMSLSFDIDGKGYDPSVLTGMYAFNLKSLDYNNFVYRNIILNARANEGLVQASASCPDSVHAFGLDLLADMRGAYPDIKSSLDLISLDLQKMGFSNDPLHLSGQTQIDIPKLDPDHPAGYFLVTNLKGLYDTATFNFDSLIAISSYRDEIQTLNITSDFAKVVARGNYSVSSLLPEIINFINLYYIVTEPAPALLGNQQADISLTVFPSAQLSDLFPTLSFSENIHAQIDLDSKNCRFDITGHLPKIQYGDQYISKASFVAEAVDTVLQYKIYIDGYQSSLYNIPTILVQGDIRQRLLYTDVRLLDAQGRLQHTMAAFIQQRDSGYAIHIDPKSVSLDYEPWGLSGDNELIVSTKGIFANSFTFSNGSQAMVLQTFGNNLNDPLSIRLFNFKISTFTSLARQDSLYLEGTVNGYAEIQLSTEHPEFFADMEVQDLLYKKDTLGMVVFKVSNDIQDVYVVNAKMTGNGNMVFVAGNYNLSEDAFDIQFDVERMNLKTIEPFALGYMNQMKGHLEGGLYISGNLDKPVVTGNMLFREAEGRVPLLNSVFSLRNERIRFMRDGMYFNNFTLTDKNKKKAILNGSINTDNWLEYRFNVDFVAENFQVINSTRRDNKLFYGNLFLDSRIQFKGTSENPVIKAGFRANPKTDLTMVLPQSDPELAERQGVVDFFDADIVEDDSAFEKKIDSLSLTGIKGLDLSANFEVDPQVKLSFIIDEANGDMLVAKGTANLNSSLDPSGKVSVTGTYELSEGSYSMTMKLLKFNFNIAKGSTITWTGEPTNADINVTALYNVKTAPFDLVEQQITGESDETKAKYRDRIPFKVKLIVKGELLKPVISFDLEIAETSGISAEVVSTINSKLEQLRIDESQMNQQVFALILFNSFIPDNPFASSSSSANASILARQSVSKLLSSQLNQLAGSLISGVDVDIGIESDADYSMGTSQMRTDLNVAFSKRLLKDRLKITVGSNFELEGNARPNEKTSNIAGDIKADYTLTRDGRYLLRAYRIDQYEVALQGQVVETGVTFIINLNFDFFREIFEKKKKQLITP